MTIDNNRRTTKNFYSPSHKYHTNTNIPSISSPRKIPKFKSYSESIECSTNTLEKEMPNEYEKIIESSKDSATKKFDSIVSKFPQLCINERIVDGYPEEEEQIPDDNNPETMSNSYLQLKIAEMNAEKIALLREKASLYQKLGINE